MIVSGKVALITGAAEGLGRAFAEALLKKGAKGIGIADVNVAKGQETTHRFVSQYGSNKAVFLKCDVTNDDELRDAFRKTKEKYGSLDIVCNNAGIGDETKWKQMIGINLTAVVHGTYLAREYMSKLNGGQGGAVINIASMAGLILGPACPVYTATKHGVVAFTRTMTTFDPAFSPDDIRINTLCPTFADTAIIGRTKAPAFIDALIMGVLPGQAKIMPVSNVAEGFMKLVEEDHHDRVMRITHEKGMDFHKFKRTPPVPSNL